MSENIIYTKLFSTLQELSTIELNEISLTIAIIKKNIVDLINKNMDILNNEFTATCKYYGKKDSDVSAQKEEILNGYKAEFDKIASKLEEEYMNFALALQETQSNQKITIANFKKVLESKKIYIESKEYNDFLNHIQDLEIRRDNSEIKTEFDQIDQYLNNISDPIENYNKNIDILANRYIKYCGLEEAYFIKLKECREKVEISINSVMQYDIGKLAKVNKKSIFSIFSKIFNKISGSKKFEKEYVSKKFENIKKIQNNTAILLEKIDNEIDTTLIEFDTYKSNITAVSKQAV